MQEPTLASYDLTADQYERWKRVGEHIVPLIAACVLNSNREPMTPYSDRLVALIQKPGLTPEGLTQLIRDAAHIRVVGK